MKFGFYSGFNQSLQEKGAKNTAEWAQKNGYSAVEFLQINADAWYKGVETISQARDMQKILQNHNLTTACYSVGVNLLEGKTAVDWLKKQAELAAELQSPYLHHTLIDSLSLPPNAPTFDAVFQPILDAASEVALYCQQLGITCLYEEQGMYFNGVKNFGRFFIEMQKRFQNVGVCGDFGNIFFADETPDEFFKVFLPYIKHVHVKDYEKSLTPTESGLQSKKGTFLQDVPLGEGVVAWERCLQLLKSVGYDGYFSLEQCNPTVNDPPTMKLLEKSFR